MVGKDVIPRGADGEAGEGNVSGALEPMTWAMVCPETSMGLVCIFERSGSAGGEKQAFALAIVSMSALSWSWW